MIGLCDAVKHANGFSLWRDEDLETASCIDSGICDERCLGCVKLLVLEVQWPTQPGFGYIFDRNDGKLTTS